MGGFGGMSNVGAFCHSWTVSFAVFSFSRLKFVLQWAPMGPGLILVV